MEQGEIMLPLEPDLACIRFLDAGLHQLHSTLKHNLEMATSHIRMLAVAFSFLPRHDSLIGQAESAACGAVEMHSC